MGNIHKIKMLVSVIIAISITTSVLVQAGSIVNLNDTENKDIIYLVEESNIICVDIPVETYQINEKNGYQKIEITDFGRIGIPGTPNLPSKIFAIAIPPNAYMTSIDFQFGEKVILDGEYTIEPTPIARLLADENKIKYDQDMIAYEKNYNSVYLNNENYPQKVVEFVRNAGYREYNIVDVRVTPFSYNPILKELVYYSEIEVNIQYEYNDGATNVIPNNSYKIDQFADNIIVNYDQAKKWYNRETRNLGRGENDFVIVTLDSLVSSVIPLVTWETTKGRNVEVVTTTWISSNYIGYDLAEKIRNFLREKYLVEEWGIEDVLLVGHYDNVPMRRTAQDEGYGQPETDFYYAELSEADAQSWDADGDHQYGENSDPIDYYAEVNVGRIPWSTPSIVLNICQKSVDYELNTDPSYKKNILLLGGYFWNNDPNPVTDNAFLMEAKVDQPWMSDWTMTRMYEQNIDCYSSFACDYSLLHSNVMAVWPSETFGFVNWAGHGSPTSSHIYGIGAPYFIASSDCPSLNDDYPSIIFADACSNSDTDNLNIGQAMMQQGGVGFLGATKVAFGSPGWNGPEDGSTQSLDYYFTSYVTSGDYTIGEAHQKALIDMYTMGLWSSLKYELFEWGALWGNPDLGMETPSLKINFPYGIPEYIGSDASTPITVEIREVMDTYVPDSGLLYYRINGGLYDSMPLVSLGGNLFEATLPEISCGDVPEFYISVQATEAGEIKSPSDAPLSTYTCIVGWLNEVYADNFETTTGWYVENSPGLGDGPWDRGVPVGGGERGDPAYDYDGSGSCYLTDNVYGNSDVDDGTTWLISPAYDVTDGDDALISCAIWYSNNFGSDPYNDLFKIYLSDNDGADWTEIMVLGPQSSEGWKEYSFWVGDYVTLTSTVRIRFEASDLNDGSVVEAGVDDFSISLHNCGICGDVNNDSIVNVSDAIYIINYLFIPGSPVPLPLCSADINGDGIVNISDVVTIVNYVFLGEPELVSTCCG